MDVRTFMRSHDGIKTGYTKDVQPAAVAERRTALK
jgi:hypothetical protein